MAESIAPCFLVAVPQLSDPNFRHSVVLLLRHEDDGTLGIVINRETPLLLRELCDDHEIPYSGDPSKRVRQGGPVQPQQGFVLFGEEHADIEGQAIQDGLRFSAFTSTLGNLCHKPGYRFQCYAGYAGWGPGQLERELVEGSWIVTPSDPKSVLDADPKAIWLEVLRANGIDPAAIVPGGGRS